MKHNKISAIAAATLLAMGFTAAASASDRVIIKVDNSTFVSIFNNYICIVNNVQN